MKSIGVIPARYASTRLPGKPLADMGGKPMLRHVYERAACARALDEVLIATDDERIIQAARSWGAKAIMTSRDCASGSDRVLEVATKFPADIFVNIQGDEPFLPPQAIDCLVHTLHGDSQIGVATLCHRLPPKEALQTQHVKVVCKDNGDALYFSRAPIPNPVDRDTACYLVHRGIYAFTSEALQLFGKMPPSTLERIEKLEQLRLLQSGIPIRMVEVEPYGPSIDTMTDLLYARRLLAGISPIDSDLETRLAQVEIVLADVDGVLTDGGLFYTDAGESIKAFNARDGIAIRLLRQNGIEIGIVSGHTSPALEARLKDLDIQLCALASADKGLDCRELLEKANIPPERAIFIGDDIPDLDAFTVCGLSGCPCDAAEPVLEAADLVLNVSGGQGVLREAAERILKSRNREAG